MNLFRFNDFNMVNESYTNMNVNVGDIYDEPDVYTYIQKLHRNDDDFWDGDLGKRIEKFKKYKVMEIPISDIDIDQYYFDEDDVDDYSNKYIELGTYPPIVLGNKKYGYYDIIDGTHRVNALNKLGIKKVIAFVGIKNKKE